MSKLIEERENGTYYVGNLKPAIAYLCDWYSDVREGLREDGSYIVGEYLEGDDEPHQWGVSASGDREEAWRYFAGTDFGPVDEGYDEAALRDALAPYVASV